MLFDMECAWLDAEASFTTGPEDVVGVYLAIHEQKGTGERMLHYKAKLLQNVSNRIKEHSCSPPADIDEKFFRWFTFTNTSFLLVKELEWHITKASNTLSTKQKSKYSSRRHHKHT